MRIRLHTFLLGISGFLIGCGPAEEPVSFNDHIRPIFNEHCVGCHGGVKQAGGFGLVFRENALREGDSGKMAIVSGDAGASEIIRRMRHENPELRMPLDGPYLSEDEVQLVERWIEQGAHWEEHWAYQPPASDLAEGSIDGYVRRRLDRDSITPAPAAAPVTLLRRLSLDLTGLPPTQQQMQDFLADPSEAAYRAAVDSLLASPRFGEHWASSWLDLARYADSKGYERDPGRTIYPYRDWVIRAFNQDMPFDQFTIEQLAGDLLPNPTEDQLIATAFHRNTPSNEEGGTDNEEYRVVSTIDRVNTTWEVWQGTTMGCVQCHSHPYDPIKHEEFYEAYAYFDQAADHDHFTDYPGLAIRHRANAEKTQRVLDWVAEHEDAAALAEWKRLLRTREPMIRPHHFEDIVEGRFTDRADEDFLMLSHGGSFALPAQPLDEVNGLVFYTRELHPVTLEFRLDTPDGPLLATHEREEFHWGKLIHVPIEPVSGHHRIFVTARGNPEIYNLTAFYGVLLLPELPGDKQAGYEEVASFVQNLSVAEDSVSLPIMTDLPAERARTTRLFERGNWLVHGDTIHADGNRLDLARRLVSGDDPLTARVTVNRFWAYLFGRGLVATVGDMGSQGARPSHPELLDHLAVRFSGELDWSIKALLREIVLSNTYRQSSDIRPELQDRDPHNELLARGPRHRLSAEQLRDQMLFVSGLLSDKMYGPGVMPPQPEGLWDNVVYSGMRWVVSEGEDRYRRAVYTYLRRSVLHPSLTTFDGANREVCLSQRSPTNTPLQALATLNDPAFAEGMRHLAQRVGNAYATPEARIEALYEHLFYRPIAPADRATLLDLHEQAADHYADEEEALFLVVNALFNLDEFLSKT